jgi:hypothetical protein
VIYVGVALLIKQNRTQKGIKNVFIGLLVAEIIIDLIWRGIYYRWGTVYYHNGTYMNYGIGAVYGMILWIPILAVTLAIITAKNR